MNLCVCVDFFLLLIIQSIIEKFLTYHLFDINCRNNVRYLCIIEINVILSRPHEANGPLEPRFER